MNLFREEKDLHAESAEGKFSMLQSRVVKNVAESFQKMGKFTVKIVKQQSTSLIMDMHCMIIRV